MESAQGHTQWIELGFESRSFRVGLRPWCVHYAPPNTPGLMKG